MAHTPVLLDEVIKYLDPKPNEDFIDATFGEGGHVAAILNKTAPKGRVLGIETDTELYGRLISGAAEFPISVPFSVFSGHLPQGDNFPACAEDSAGRQFSNRLILVNDSYANLKRIVEECRFGPVHGILFDLGMSSWHLEESGRGFSFLRDEPLDMRFSKKRQELTARELVNQWPEARIEEILREYGEERWSRRIARSIVEKRKRKPIETTFELVEIVKKAAPRAYERGRISPATRTFQALRIAVNNELENLKTGLAQALEILAPAGKIAVISFHSLEDRIVKNFFRDQAKEGPVEILTKKPVIPAPEEIRRNPRARSAKLRAAIKI